MPNRPNHPCGQPGCGVLVPTGTARCPRHAGSATLGQRPYQRPASDGFYGTYTWKQFRASVLRKRGNICAMCGCWTDAPHLDHIIPRAQRPDLELDESNVRVLCSSCHSRRTLGDIHHGR